MDENSILERLSIASRVGAVHGVSGHAGDRPMPRYFFHLHNDVDAIDEEGSDLPDENSARAYAIASVRQVAWESLAKGHLDLDNFILVTNQRGDAVLQVRFGDAITVSGRS